MFKIVNKTFHVSRGDSGTVNLRLKNTTFRPEDDVVFKIYEVQGLDSAPIIEVHTSVEEESDTINIELNGEEHTNFGDLGNEIVDYWYEIAVNEDRTIIGFDENGAKIFKLYPTGEPAPEAEEGTTTE